MAELEDAVIPESYFEYNAEFKTPMFEAWSIPNRIVAALYPILKPLNVSLSDIVWNQETKSFKDLQVTFNIQRLNVTLKIGVDSAKFAAFNPDWSEAPALLELFESSVKTIREAGKSEVVSQDVGLALHVKSAKRPFDKIMSGLVNTEALGNAQTYGVSAYEGDSSFVIDKSVRYTDAVFIRLNRKFPPSVAFKDIAAAVYIDEQRVLSILGLQELLQ